MIHWKRPHQDQIAIKFYGPDKKNCGGVWWTELVMTSIDEKFTQKGLWRAVSIDQSTISDQIAHKCAPRLIINRQHNHFRLAACCWSTYLCITLIAPVTETAFHKSAYFKALSFFLHDTLHVFKSHRITALNTTPASICFFCVQIW